jgi:hypothetical protein
MAVSHKETLKHQIETMHYVIKKVIDDIKEEESMRTIGSSPNHIKWQTGHLVFAAMLAGNTLGVSLAPPAGWNKLFGRGAEPPDKQKDFPPMEDLRATLYEFQKRVLAHLETVSEEHLVTKCEIAPSWEDSPLNALLFFCGHDFYHCGQIALIRHELGRERSFG